MQHRATADSEKSDRPNRRISIRWTIVKEWYTRV